MAHLLAVYDGVAPPLVPEAKEVEVHGETVKLSKLVASVTQFVTKEILEEGSVLFWDHTTAEDIRECVKNGGKYLGSSGARLKDTLDWRVRGRPMHSQSAEKLVNVMVTSTADTSTADTSGRRPSASETRPSSGWLSRRATPRGQRSPLLL